MEITGDLANSIHEMLPAYADPHELRIPAGHRAQLEAMRLLVWSVPDGEVFTFTAVGRAVYEALRKGGFPIADAVLDDVILTMLATLADTGAAATALQLLVEIGRGMVVLLRLQMGRMDAGAFLSAAAVNDAVRRRHAFILLDGKPGGLPADVERHRAELAVPVVETPADAADADNWADLLEAVALASRLPTR